jgi:hypothetical protein
MVADAKTPAEIKETPKRARIAIFHLLLKTNFFIIHSPIDF